MMEQFNKDQAVVYNTIQHYRSDRLSFLKDSYEAAAQRDFILGAKLVRGRIWRRSAAGAGDGICFADPADKETTDRDYNEGVPFLYRAPGRIAVIVASHNEYSICMQ